MSNKIIKETLYYSLIVPLITTLHYLQFVLLLQVLALGL